MSKKVAIIDYQICNLFSVLNACKYVGLDAIITNDKKEIESADAAILPGVGAFAEAMSNLQNLGLVETIKDFVSSERLFLGICLGMQLLFSRSEEFCDCTGLDIVKGFVKKFPSKNHLGENIKVPQIGWNRIHISATQKALKQSWNPLTADFHNEYMYFVHSYYVITDNTDYQLTTTCYEGVEYCSSILKDNILATQFHPEKSAKRGIEIYQNWANAIN